MVGRGLNRVFKAIVRGSKRHMYSFRDNYSAAVKVRFCSPATIYLINKDVVTTFFRYRNRVFVYYFKFSAYVFSLSLILPVFINPPFTYGFPSPPATMDGTESTAKYCFPVPHDK